MVVIGGATMLWKALRTSTIAEILLLSILLSCPQPAGVPMPPYSSRASKSQRATVWAVQHTHIAPHFP